MERKVKQPHFNTGQRFKLTPPPTTHTHSECSFTCGDKLKTQVTPKLIRPLQVTSLTALALETLSKELPSAGSSSAPLGEGGSRGHRRSKGEEVQTSPIGKYQAESPAHAQPHLRSQPLRIQPLATSGPKCQDRTGPRGGSCLERTPHVHPRPPLASRLPTGRLTGKLLSSTGLPSSRGSPFRPASRKRRAGIGGRRQLNIGVSVRQYVGRLARTRLGKQKCPGGPPAVGALSSFVLSCSRWWPPGQSVASAASLPPGRSDAQVRPG